MNTTFQSAIAANPLLQSYKTPHETVPFQQIKNTDYFPALEEAIKVHNLEIEKIINQKQNPTFENTIVALERSGGLLEKVTSPFYNMLSANTSDELQDLAQKIQPILTEHSNSIQLNEKLFDRIKSVYSQNESLNLNTEDAMLLQETYDSFANNGANLSAADKDKYRSITKELSAATLKFGTNVLKENNQWNLLITDKTLLSGLPEDLLENLSAAAKKQNKTGWLLDLKATTYVPLMKYADNRDLRREIYMAYTTRNSVGGEYDNQENIRKIVNLRLQLANLLGKENYADHVLRRRMAENKENVYKLLNELLEAYKPYAIKESEAVQAYADKQGAYFKIQSWDWSYYSEKLKNEQFAINDEMLKPYFKLENVIGGVFELAEKLYGLNFKENKEIQVYHPDVKAFEVYDQIGKFLSVLYTDFHPRDSKRSGAWMSEIRGQKKVKGVDQRPQIMIVMNFTKPTESKPSLLTYDELTTFLHEFGHALHGMLSDCTYESLSGTNVYRDFVELPSQIMENWASEKDFLDGFAANYLSNEKIPAELIQKIKAADNFNAANFCLRQLSFGYLDMAWHTLKENYEGNIIQFEKSAIQTTQILPVIKDAAVSPTFSHIFSGGYAAGYYSYKWAEVLDADAFSVFAKNGIFDKKTAEAFRKDILSQGGTIHPMTLYKSFRGQEPDIQALLKRNGIQQ